jgi:hypothetical protein
VTFHSPISSFSITPSHLIFIITVNFWETVQSFLRDKSVIEISQWQATGTWMGESSGKAATLLNQDLLDNFLCYHLWLSSTVCPLHFTPNARLWAFLSWNTDAASFYYSKWKPCLHMFCHMCWILSEIIMPSRLFRSSSLTSCKGPKLLLTVWSAAPSIFKDV